MPNHDELCAYETGIRVTQASSRLNKVEAIPEGEILNALIRLESAVTRLCAIQRNNTPQSFDRGNHIIGSAVRAWMDASHVGTTTDCGASLTGQIQTLSGLLTRAFNEAGPVLSHWYQLGLEIADGSDETWSEGTFEFIQRDSEESASHDDRNLYPIMAAIGGKSPRWDWSDEARIQQLIESVSVSLDVLFPGHQAQPDADNSIFRQLQVERYWAGTRSNLGCSISQVAT